MIHAVYSTAAPGHISGSTKNAVRVAAFCPLVVCTSLHDVAQKPVNTLLCIHVVCRFVLSFIGSQPRNQFYAELDLHTPRLVAMYRQKTTRTGKISEVLRDILQIYDLQVSLV